ncbi:YaeQ family protein [Pseudoalteromonas sp. S16_S37]|uniref:YaeQ family protein n=1 Tax=Pseudoalteromonas sp. S16_S37 TaxID=2720228 RepID=UPI0016812D6D|nr:YaeQ family protein [Pseudoalteromonas sp. S16_S37]MBD1583326.1 YaeQ family protein [Pseudoalteromonas sp. S16_S37]
MALKSTIIKTQLSLSDMDRHIYQTLSLTVAQHPSENEQRLMVRLLAYALQYQERLEFTKGLCADDEPEIWVKNYSDEIELWVELGLPDEKRLKKACNRAKQVVLYTYGENAQAIWWQKNQAKLANYDNLSVVSLPYSATELLAKMAARSLSLTVTVQDGEIWVSDEQNSVHCTPELLK